MAHNLMTRRGRVAMLAGRDGTGEVAAPWHGLGQRLPALATKDEVLRLAGLDWKIETAPINYERLDAEGMGTVQIKGRRAILGPSKDDGTRPVFGIVSEKWTPLQNEAVLDFVFAVVGQDGAIFDTAGALGDGERVFVSVKMPRAFEVVPGDEVQPYLLFALGHDGLMGLYATPTPIRVVCQNTLNAAIGTLVADRRQGRRLQTGIWFNHAGNLDKRVAAAREFLGLSVKVFESFEALAKRLASLPASKVAEDAFLRKVLPIENPEEEEKVLASREEVRTLAHSGIGQDLPGVEGSAWGLWNGFTEWADFYRSGMGERADPANRFESAALGASARDKARALSTLVAIVAADGN